MPDLLLGSLKCGREALLVERLEQIIERMHLEGLHRVTVVSGHKNNHRHAPSANGLEYAETIQFRHLHIEKNQIRFAFFNGRDGSPPVGALSNHLDLRIAGEQTADSLAAQRLVIDNKCPDFHLESSASFFSAASSAIH